MPSSWSGRYLRKVQIYWDQVPNRNFIRNLMGKHIHTKLACYEWSKRGFFIMWKFRWPWGATFMCGKSSIHRVIAIYSENSLIWSLYFGFWAGWGYFDQPISNFTLRYTIIRYTMSSVCVCPWVAVYANRPVWVYMAPVGHQMRKQVVYRSDDTLVKNLSSFLTCFGSTKNPTSHIVPTRFTMAWNELTRVVDDDAMVLMRSREITRKADIERNRFRCLGLLQLHHLLLGGQALLDGVDTALDAANAGGSTRSDWALERQGKKKIGLGHLTMKCGPTRDLIANNLLTSRPSLSTQ